MKSKLLGIYDGLYWKNQLIEAGIPCHSQKAGGILNLHIGRGSTASKYKLYVHRDDYDKAIQFIKEKRLEDYRKSEAMVQIDGQEADKAMFKVLIGIICLVGAIIFIIGNKEGWW